MTEMKNEKENSTFRLLSALGILLVVAGHADLWAFDVGGLFPYYSFHVELFLFISGYFYRESDEERIGSYIGRKAGRLLAPYFIWNVFYGLLAALLRQLGFWIGGGVSLRTLFLEPFLTGHQFGYNFPAWFVPALFLVELIHICLRKALKILKIPPVYREWLMLAGCLAAGLLTVRFAIGGHVWGYYKFPGRILFMLPVFVFGRLYRVKLEALDRLPNAVYFGVLFLLQLTVTLCCNGLAFSTVWCTGFANGPFVPYLTVVTGIAFWLRVAKVLAPALGKSAFFNRLGAETWSVMMHHIAAFMLVKGIFFAVSVLTPFCRDFDRAAFFSDVNYLYLLRGADAAKWIYLAAGIALPLLLRQGVEKIRIYKIKRRSSAGSGSG